MIVLLLILGALVVLTAWDSDRQDGR